MPTPESKVKAKVKTILAKYDAYYFMPATHGYGSSGVPDIVACVKGRFIGIECKANGKKPTALQMKNMMSAVDRGGISLIVDETGLGVLDMLFSTWMDTGMPPQGYISELLKVDESKTN
jgi:hypothetical protein